MKKSVTHPLVLVSAMTVLTLSPAADADVTGNINVVSKYVLRGITNGGANSPGLYGTENTGAAVQGGFDYSHSSGVYAGYWGSSLSYVDTTAPNSNFITGFESDFYAGYKGKAGPVSFGAGVIVYAYTGVTNSDATEVVATVGIGNASLGIQYLTRDVVWGNAGDTYFNLGYAQPLPSDFSLAASVMYYLYDKNGKFITDTVPPTEKGSAFRGVQLTLSHPLGKTGGTMAVSVVGGGEDRFGLYQKFMPVLSVGMTF